MIGQITITIPQAKKLIALAVLELPEVKAARTHGKVILKAGTTVAGIAAKLGVPPLRLGGRITPDGARAAKSPVDAPFIVVVENGAWRAVDQSLPAELQASGPNDLFITGANAIDTQGVAGLLAGIEGGSTAGKALGSLWSEGITTIIATGLEKLIPGSIFAACKAAGRKRVEKSMGMAVGLLPIFGKIITEKEAIELLTGVTATVIAAGGLFGAEGATTLIIEGTTEQVNMAFSLLENSKDCPVHCAPESLDSCKIGGPSCASHLGCIYKPR